jgi:hypothetical protein
MNVGILYQICILLSIEIHWVDHPGKAICKFLKHLGEDLNERSQENTSSRLSVHQRFTHRRNRELKNWRNNTEKKV